MKPFQKITGRVNYTPQTDGSYQLSMSVEGQPAKTMRGSYEELYAQFTEMTKATDDLIQRSTLAIWFCPYDTSTEPERIHYYVYDPNIGLPFLVSEDGGYFWLTSTIEVRPHVQRGSVVEDWWAGNHNVQNDRQVAAHFRYPEPLLLEEAEQLDSEADVIWNQIQELQRQREIKLKELQVKYTQAFDAGVPLTYKEIDTMGQQQYQDSLDAARRKTRNIELHKSIEEEDHEGT